MHLNLHGSYRLMTSFFSGDGVNNDTPSVLIGLKDYWVEITHLLKLATCRLTVQSILSHLDTRPHCCNTVYHYTFYTQRKY